MKYKLLIITILAIGFVACDNSREYTPKPTTYFRITLPEHTYKQYDTTALEFTFEHDTNSQVIFKKNNSYVKWIDVVYPKCNGKLFISYKKIKDKADLAVQIDTAWQLLGIHRDKSSGMDEEIYKDPQNKVFATIYRLKGQQIASTCQFWVTDSSKNFIRGALYIDEHPNYDSLEPVIKYLQTDVDHLIQTLHWK